jgi:signal recognition particle subunit SRP54
MGKDLSFDEFRALLRQVDQAGILQAVDEAASQNISAVFREGWEVFLSRLDRVIGAMTPEERREPDQIPLHRRHEIAAQSNTPSEEIDRVLAQFLKLRALKRQLAEMTTWQQIDLVFNWNRTIEAG